MEDRLADRMVDRSEGRLVDPSMADRSEGRLVDPSMADLWKVASAQAEA
jgi:hypothetical protein